MTLDPFSWFGIGMLVGAFVATCCWCLLRVASDDDGD